MDGGSPVTIAQVIGGHSISFVFAAIESAAKFTFAGTLGALAHRAG
jgi:hypothetical protein